MDERLAISSTNISSERDTRAIRLWLYAVAALILAVVLAGLRRWLPRQTDIDKASDEEIRRCPGGC